MGCTWDEGKAHHYFCLFPAQFLPELGVAKDPGQGVQQRGGRQQGQEEVLDEAAGGEVQLQGEVEEVGRYVGHPGQAEDQDVRNVANVQLFLKF